MKTIKSSRPRTRTTKEISADYSAVDARHTRKRSTQTTISLSSFNIIGTKSLVQAKQLAKECEQVARRYTRATPRLLDIQVQAKGIHMHVAQPQLAVHLAEHMAQSHRQMKPSTSVAWSRDAVNKVVDVKVEFHDVKKPTKAPKARQKPQPQELHKWAGWYKWQDKQQTKKKASE